MSRWDNYEQREKREGLLTEDWWVDERYSAALYTHDRVAESHSRREHSSHHVLKI